jgi:hypothetical protein
MVVSHQLPPSSNATLASPTAALADASLSKRSMCQYTGSRRPFGSSFVRRMAHPNSPSGTGALSTQVDISCAMPGVGPRTRTPITAAIEQLSRIVIAILLSRPTSPATPGSGLPYRQSYGAPHDPRAMVDRAPPRNEERDDGRESRAVRAAPTGALDQRVGTRATQPVQPVPRSGCPTGCSGCTRHEAGPTDDPDRAHWGDLLARATRCFAPFPKFVVRRIRASAPRGAVR